MRESGRFKRYTSEICHISFNFWKEFILKQNHNDFAQNDSAQKQRAEELASVFQLRFPSTLHTPSHSNIIETQTQVHVLIFLTKQCFRDYLRNSWHICKYLHALGCLTLVCKNVLMSLTQIWWWLQICRSRKNIKYETKSRGKYLYAGRRNYFYKGCSKKVLSHLVCT